MSYIFGSGGGSGPSSGITTITGDTGGAVGPSAGNVNLVGSGTIIVNGNPSTNTLTITNTAITLVWHNVTGTSQTMSLDNGYVANNASLVSLELPPIGAFGSVVRVGGNGAGGWTITQVSGQSINVGSVVSTTGIGGSVSSTNQYDSIELLCLGSSYIALSFVGNLTIV